MSENNKQYSLDLASEILERVFDDCAPKPDGSTKGLHTAVAATIYTGLQIAEKRGEIIAGLREKTCPQCPKLKPAKVLSEAVDWILVDALYKAPEEVGAIGQRWVETLQDALKEGEEEAGA